MPRFPWVACAVSVLCLCPARLLAPPEPDFPWTADAVLVKQRQLTLEGLGAAQGATLFDGKVYLYGDVYDARPRVGVIREYTANLEPTGRVLWLRRANKPLLLHPTGLTRHTRHGTFLGDTVNRKAVIYRLDWNRAWKDGNLDRAVLDVIRDDAAVNGCRPEFVEHLGKAYLATSDYGDVRPEVRLYDVEKMLRAGRTSAPGVTAHRFLCGPFNQNLHFDGKTGQLTCIQNVIAGRGWRLDILDLGKAIADGRADGPGVRVRRHTFFPHNELEGFRPLDEGRSLFVTSSRKNNVVVGEIRTVKPKESPAGTGLAP
jgi:hypothetical protein